jgi:hypothetical protein
MVLQWGLQKVVDNVGLSFEWIVLLVTTLSTLPFFAKDFKLGIILLMVIQGGIFVWFYNAGMDYTYNLVVFFASLVILALSLFAVNSTSTTGGFN